MRKLALIIAFLALAIPALAQNVAAPDSITAGVVLDSLDETIEIPLDGKTSASFVITANSSPNMTINAEVSGNNGTTWHGSSIRFIAPDGDISTALVDPAAPAFYGVIIPSGGTHVRVRVTVFTSGSVTGSLSATSVLPTIPLVWNGAGVDDTFGFNLLGVVDSGTARRLAGTPQGAAYVSLRDSIGAPIDTAIASPSNTATGLVVREAVSLRTYNAPTAATVGVASAQALASNTARKGLVLKNTSNNTISCAVAATAVLNSGITLEAGDAYTMSAFAVASGAVNCIASAASSNLSIQEIQ